MIELEAKQGQRVQEENDGSTRSIVVSNRALTRGPGCWLWRLYLVESLQGLVERYHTDTG